MKIIQLSKMMLTYKISPLVLFGMRVSLAAETWAEKVSTNVSNVNRKPARTSYSINAMKHNANSIYTKKDAVEQYANSFCNAITKTKNVSDAKPIFILNPEVIIAAQNEYIRTLHLEKDMKDGGRIQLKHLLQKEKQQNAKYVSSQVVKQADLEKIINPPKVEFPQQNNVECLSPFLTPQFQGSRPKKKHYSKPSIPSSEVVDHVQGVQENDKEDLVTKNDNSSDSDSGQEEKKSETEKDAATSNEIGSSEDSGATVYTRKKVRSRQKKVKNKKHDKKGKSKSKGKNELINEDQLDDLPAQSVGRKLLEHIIKECKTITLVDVIAAFLVGWFLNKLAWELLNKL